MARGQRDYGIYAPEQYLAGMSDMAELAVRLGSIVIFDRRGKVIDLDDFESPVLKWSKWLDALAVSADAILDSNYPKSGSQCLKMTVAPAPDDWVYVTRGFIPLKSKRIGIEIAFSLPSTNTYFNFGLYYQEPTTQFAGVIRVDFNAKILYYMNRTGVLTWIADVDTFVSLKFIQYPIKLVIDQTTHKYVKLILGLTEYDLSTYDLWEPGGAGDPQMYAEAHLIYRAGAISHLYLDDYIMTIDEP